jgi:cellulose synthase/poly-beta-1,6-N-acetylglucosamine synthase-like glycosyltransferase
MYVLEWLFWLCLAIPFYAYLGYGILLWILVISTRNKRQARQTREAAVEQPEVTLLIAAYNELDQVILKMKNCRELVYPKAKLKIVWVTDGSNDGTAEALRAYPDVTVLHQAERNGKIAAVNRAMSLVSTPIVIFSDANTMLNPLAVVNLVRHFANPKVGCVSGEKRILELSLDHAAGAGEGLYWRYESQLKKWDAELYSAVGAAGELFAIRTALYPPVSRDTVLDDFVISLKIAMLGYRIAYEPDAYAVEVSSADMREELKRKIRISAGGIQAVVELYPLLQLWKYGLFSFQYISHRVLRWTLAPIGLLLLLPLNLALAWQDPGFYRTFCYLHVLFYISAFLGLVLEKRQVRFKLLFVPFYFLFMNYAVLRGLQRYFAGRQTTIWEKAQRSELRTNPA